MLQDVSFSTDFNLVCLGLFPRHVCSLEKKQHILWYIVQAVNTKDQHSFLGRMNEFIMSMNFYQLPERRNWIWVAFYGTVSCTVSNQFLLP